MQNPIPKITLEQWRTLQAVVDHGGFAEAAEALNRSQSSISYAIARLQDQLPTPALVRNGRKAELTEAGAVLLRRSRALVDEALGIERLAQSLAEGWEAEIRLAADIIFPPHLLLETLGGFAASCRALAHETRVQIIESVLSGTTEALLTREADLAITGQVPPGFMGQPLIQVHFIAVTHRDHLLQHLGRQVTTQDLKAHRQLVVRDSGLMRKQDSGWLGAEQRWTVSHMKTSIQALKQNLGFAWVPREHIQDELKDGLLCPINLVEGGTRTIQLYLVFADYDSAGPGTRELARILEDACANRPLDQ